MAVLRSAMLLGVPMLVAGCQPVVCEDTRPPLLKLLFGLPLPTLVTLVVALGHVLTLGKRIVEGKSEPAGEACGEGGGTPSHRQLSAKRNPLGEGIARPPPKGAPST